MFPHANNQHLQRGGRASFNALIYLLINQLNMKKLNKITKSFVTFVFIASVSTSIHSSTGKEAIQNYINKGIEYGNSGQLDKAINEFEKILKIDPNNVDAFNNLGDAAKAAC